MAQPIQRRRLRTSLLITTAALAALVPFDSARPQQPAPDALASLKIADGLEVTLFASEPMVNNPTAIDIDARGRVWVTEGVNYRHTRSGPQGQQPDPDADRVKILEDTDGDGRADKVTVFADGLIVPMSVAVAGNQVYVGESPHLWVFTDVDGDGRADQKESLLEGFEGRDSDHGLHGLVLGPDGRLYMTVGDEGMDVTDRSGNRVAPFKGVMLRVNLDGTGLTALADNFRNPYELTVDSWGNVFCSDNDIDGRRGVRICWILEGGDYGWRGPDSPSGDHWREDLPGYVPKILGTGNGSPCGIAMYEGDLLPERFRGALLHVDAGPRVLRAYHLSPDGAGYKGEPEVIVSSQDQWFRPVDVAVHPDGSVFFADWYDAGVGGHRYSDNDTGRIYRLAPKGARPARAPQLDLESQAGLLEALQSPTPAVRFLAIEELMRRGDEAVGGLLAVAKRETGSRRARAIAVLGRLQRGRKEIRRFADDADARTRAQVLRILREQPDDEELGVILSAADDPDAHVRREVLLALRDVPTQKASEALVKLVRRYDGRDRFYLETLGLALRQREPEWIAGLFPAEVDDGREAALMELAWGLFRGESLPFLARVVEHSTDDGTRLRAVEALRSIADPAAGRLAARMVLEDDDASRRRLALDILAANLAERWKGLRQAPEIEEALGHGLQAPELQLAAIDAIRRAGVRSLTSAVLDLASDANAPEETRKRCLAALGELGATEAGPLARSLVDAERQLPDNPEYDPQRPVGPLAVAALQTLFQISGPTHDYVRGMISDRSHPNVLRRYAVRLVGRTPAGCHWLLDQAERRQLALELRGVATQVVHGMNDKQVRARAAELLPLPTTAAGKTLPPISQLVRRDGDAERGREVFLRENQDGALCSRCHRVRGRGEWIGPDLSQIGTKLAREALFDAILNPSAGIAHEYRPYALAMTNGQVLTGLIADETGRRLVLKTAEGERIAIDPSEIEEQAAQSVSIMPDNLAASMSEQDLVDVVAFLETLREPVLEMQDWYVLGPLPAGAVDPAGPIDLGAHVRTPEGATYRWERRATTREGLLELRPGPRSSVDGEFYCLALFESPTEQEGELVIDANGPFRVWLNGDIEATATGVTKVGLGRATIAARSNRLLVRVATKTGEAQVRATLVSAEPLEQKEKQ